MTNETRINMVLFIFLACLWSGSFIAIKEVVNVWPPLFSAVVRVAIALLSLILLILFMRKNIRVPFSLRWKIWIIGLFAQAFPFAFLFWGERLISPGLAGILNGTVSIWTYVFALIFLPQSTSFSISKAAGLLLGIAGIVIIFWPILSFENNAATLMGASAVLIMAISYAIGNILNQHFLQGKIRIDFFTNIYHQHWASLTFLLIISLLFEKWPSGQALTTAYLPMISSLYLGIFSTAIAFVIFYHLIREWDSLRASTVLYLIPALTLVWDYVFFATSPQPAEILGVIVILCSVIMIQLSSIRKEV